MPEYLPNNCGTGSTSLIYNMTLGLLTQDVPDDQGTNVSDWIVFSRSGSGTGEVVACVTLDDLLTEVETNGIFELRCGKCNCPGANGGCIDQACSLGPLISSNGGDNLHSHVTVSQCVDGVDTDCSVLTGTDTVCTGAGFGGGTVCVRVVLLINHDLCVY